MSSCQKKLQIMRANIPRLWLFTDARNNAVLERAIGDLPKGSGVVFRHYHLDDMARHARFDQVRGFANNGGHLIILSGDADRAKAWGADGIYGPAARLARADNMLKLGAVHDADELKRAEAAGADAVFLSPIFPTRSHVGGDHLGIAGFTELARLAVCPVIALGGMTAARWDRMPANIAHGWAAIDGLSDKSNVLQQPNDSPASDRQ